MITQHRIDRFFIFNRQHTLAVILMGMIFLQGCAIVMGELEQLLPPPYMVNEIERNDFLVEKGEDVIGRLAVIKTEKEDTLPDIARHFSLGINGVSSANPGVDVWVPEAGERLLLPLSFILPDTRRNGIVINLAAMRLFAFKKDGNRLAVSTYPVGIGTPERPTPKGNMHIGRKKFLPTWYVPASIAEDHRKKGDPLPDKLPPILVLVYAVAFVGMILFYMLPVQIPFLLNEIGVTKNALAGLAIVVATLGSTISSLAYHRLKNRFSFATILSVLFLLMAIGFLVISSAQQYSTVIIGMIISGFGLGLLMPNLNIWLLSVTPPKIRGTAVGILTMSLFLGQFFSPIAVAPLERIYTLSGVFFLGGGFMVLISLFFVFFHFYRTRR